MTDGSVCLAGGREMISNKQYKRLMSEYKQSDNIGESAMKADVHRQTARKYIAAGKPPCELQEKHDWRTRVDWRTIHA